MTCMCPMHKFIRVDCLYIHWHEELSCELSGDSQLCFAFLGGVINWSDALEVFEFQCLNVLYVLRISIIKTEDGREVTGVPVFPQLPRFFQLCSDNVWGVRKACAECFMAVSCATCQEIRRTKLSALFINLISDPSRWVTLLFKNILRLK